MHSWTNIFFLFITWLELLREAIHSFREKLFNRSPFLLRFHLVTTIKRKKGIPTTARTFSLRFLSNPICYRIPHWPTSKTGQKVKRVPKKKRNVCSIRTVTHDRICYRRTRLWLAIFDPDTVPWLIVFLLQEKRKQISDRRDWTNINPLKKKERKRRRARTKGPINRVNLSMTRANCPALNGFWHDTWLTSRHKMVDRKTLCKEYCNSDI